MTSHLARLAARGAGQDAGLRPRALSLFEQPTNPASVDEYVAPRGPTSSAPDVAAPRPDVSMAPHSPEPGSDVDEPREPAPLPPGEPHAKAATPDQPNVRRPSGETLPTTGPRPKSEPSLDEIPAPDRPAGGRRAVEEPAIRPVPSRTPIEADSARPGPEVPPPSSVPRHPGGGRHLPDGPPAEAGDAVAVRRQGNPQPSTQPVAHEEGTSPREPMPVASQPTTLPRLQPHPWADQGQAPEVTVNIGRIEVLPPRATESKRPPKTTAPGRRTAGAPDLADYLRDRGRR